MARKDSNGRNLKTGELQRKSDGRYIYRYKDILGKRRTIYAKTLQELRDKEKAIERDLDDDIVTDSAAKKMTLNMMFDRYMETKIIKGSTRFNYMKMWNGHVRNSIGKIKLVQLRSSDIKAFYAGLSKEGYANATIDYLHTMIHPTLEMAVDDDILRKNPAHKAMSAAYGVPAKKKQALTMEQQKRMLDFVEKSNTYNVYLPMLTIFLETGLRCGELIGLTWDDVSIQEKLLSVNHQLIYKRCDKSCEFHATSPKTQAGIRKIPLTDKAVKAFTEQKKLVFALGRRNTEAIDGYNNFVFLTKYNNPFMPSAVNNALYNIVKAYNKEETERAEKEHCKPILLPNFSAHVLRHTFATNMLRKNMNVKVLQTIMGHTSFVITMDVYTHLDNSDDVRKEVERCAALEAV